MGVECGSDGTRSPARRAAAPTTPTPPTLQAVKSIAWPDDPPFSPEDFRRYDESPDSFFYAEPRFVTHIDDAAIGALTDWYGANALPPPGKADGAVLDICSSWISHYPKGYAAPRVVGLGMNTDEVRGEREVCGARERRLEPAPSTPSSFSSPSQLARNTVLTEYAVQDLNTSPRLPYADASFDCVTCTVSIDYLTKPFDVVKECHRVLRPGGVMACGISNRCFPTKAIAVWTSTGARGEKGGGGVEWGGARPPSRPADTRSHAQMTPTTPASWPRSSTTLPSAAGPLRRPKT